MNIKRLGFVTAAVVALAATTVVSVTPASAWWCGYGGCGYGYGWGWGWGPGAVAAGVLAGAAVGAAVGAAAAPRPYYGPGYAPGYAPRCPVGYHFYGGYCYPN
jgi:hypothetical protein